jgi:hypothetical protein
LLSLRPVSGDHLRAAILWRIEEDWATQLVAEGDLVQTKEDKMRVVSLPESLGRSWEGTAVAQSHHLSEGKEEDLEEVLLQEQNWAGTAEGCPGAGMGLIREHVVEQKRERLTLAVGHAQW